MYLCTCFNIPKSLPYGYKRFHHPLLRPRRLTHRLHRPRTPLLPLSPLQPSQPQDPGATGPPAAVRPRLLFRLHSPPRLPPRLRQLPPRPLPTRPPHRAHLLLGPPARRNPRPLPPTRGSGPAPADPHRLCLPSFPHLAPRHLPPRQRQPRRPPPGPHLQPHTRRLATSSRPGLAPRLRTHRPHTPRMAVSPPLHLRFLPQPGLHLRLRLTPPRRAQHPLRRPTPHHSPLFPLPSLPQLATSTLPFRLVAASALLFRSPARPPLADCSHPQPQISFPIRY